MSNDGIIKEIDHDDLPEGAKLLDVFEDIYADGGDWEDLEPMLITIINRALMAEKRITDALMFLKFVKKNVDPNIIIHILEG